MASPEETDFYEDFHRDIYRMIQEDQSLADLRFSDMLRALVRKDPTVRRLQQPDQNIFYLAQENNLFKQGLTYEDFIRRIVAAQMRQTAEAPGHSGLGVAEEVLRSRSLGAIVTAGRGAREWAVAEADEGNTGVYAAGAGPPMVAAGGRHGLIYPWPSPADHAAMTAAVEEQRILAEIVGKGNAGGKYVADQVEPAKKKGRKKGGRTRRKRRRKRRRRTRKKRRRRKSRRIKRRKKVFNKKRFLR